MLFRSVDWQLLVTSGGFQVVYSAEIKRPRSALFIIVNANY